MEAQIAEARTALGELRLADPIPTLALFGDAGRVPGRDRRDWIGDLLGRLGLREPGARGAPGGAMPGFVPVSDEVLAGLRPELVLLLSHGDPARVQAEFTRRLRGWAVGRPPLGRRAACTCSPGLVPVEPRPRRRRSRPVARCHRGGRRRRGRDARLAQGGAQLATFARRRDAATAGRSCSCCSGRPSPRRASARARSLARARAGAPRPGRSAARAALATCACRASSAACWSARRSASPAR